MHEHRKHGKSNEEEEHKINWWMVWRVMIDTEETASFCILLHLTHISKEHT